MSGSMFCQQAIATMGLALVCGTDERNVAQPNYLSLSTEATRLRSRLGSHQGRSVIHFFSGLQDGGAHDRVMAPFASRSAIASSITNIASLSRRTMPRMAVRTGGRG
jgi:hypothetical protein